MKISIVLYKIKEKCNLKIEKQRKMSVFCLQKKQFANGYLLFADKNLIFAIEKLTVSYKKGKVYG